MVIHNNDKRMYDSTRWRKARARHLYKHPLCALCRRQGVTTAATVVDHIKPHDGDYDLFWDESNYQSLCKMCHNSAKRIKENKGVYPGCDLLGMPLDSSHHWGNG